MLAVLTLGTAEMAFGELITSLKYVFISPIPINFEY
jgi:hypothetical protein